MLAKAPFSVGMTFRQMRNIMHEMQDDPSVSDANTWQNQEQSSDESEEEQPKEESTSRCATTVEQVNERSYVVSSGALPQKTEYRSGKSTLLDIHADLLRDKDNLAANEGSIRMKEYALNAYECRCHEQDDLVRNESVDISDGVFHYRLEF